jgi:hypothetical protein
MKTKTCTKALAGALFLAVYVLASAPASAALQTLSEAEFTLTYDDSTAFGWLSFWGSGGSGRFFGWDTPSPAPSAISTGAPVANDAALPAFTLAANPGWVLSGFSFQTGGSYANFAATPSTGVAASADIALDGGISSPVSTSVSNSTAPWTMGNWSMVGLNAVGSFSTLDLSNGKLSYSASAGGGGAAGILMTTKNGPQFDFQVTAVPEPETWAMLLVGVGLVGFRLRGVRMGESHKLLKV